MKNSITVLILCMMISSGIVSAITVLNADVCSPEGQMKCFGETVKECVNDTWVTIQDCTKTNQVCSRETMTCKPTEAQNSVFDITPYLILIIVLLVIIIMLLLKKRRKQA